MNKYLIEILKNHSSLILPGIGALMVTNRKTGEIKFNPHLTFNDGALATFIANEEKIDKVEAQNKVAKFTSEIKSVIDKGETYDIFQFGTIFKNKNGETAFEMAKSSSKPTLESSSKKGADKAEDKPKKAQESSKKAPAKGKDLVDKTSETAKDVASTISKSGSKLAATASDNIESVVGATKENS